MYVMVKYNKKVFFSYQDIAAFFWGKKGCNSSVVHEIRAKIKVFNNNNIGNSGISVFVYDLYATCMLHRLSSLMSIKMVPLKSWP